MHLQYETLSSKDKVLFFVQVTLCSNTLKQYRLALVVDVEGVGKEILSLPINARSDSNKYSHVLQSLLWCIANFSCIL